MSGQAHRTVRLESGGTITISGAFDLFTLSREDREFIKALTNLCETYSPLGVREVPEIVIASTEPTTSHSRALGYLDGHRDK